MLASLASVASAGLPSLPSTSPPLLGLTERIEADGLHAPSFPSAASSSSGATFSQGRTAPGPTQKAVEAEAVPADLGKKVSTVGLPLFKSAAFSAALEARRAFGGDMSEGPSESSANIEDTEDEFQSTIPSLEKFYEQMAAKVRLPPGSSASSDWVLSLARSYRRLSKDKRRRGRLRALLQPATQGGLAGGSGSSLAGSMIENPGCASNTDDSGYEAGYETDADESELSEWESGNVRQGHKRKLEALVHLTMQLSFAERGIDQREEMSIADTCMGPPPLKAPRALGTRAVGLRQSLPHASAPHSPQSGAVASPDSTALTAAFSMAPALEVSFASAPSSSSSQLPMPLDVSPVAEIGADGGSAHLYPPPKEGQYLALGQLSSSGTAPLQQEVIAMDVG